MGALIRFLPDSWRETLLRPVAMAAPDAGVYIEIMAPDFRFLFVLALLVLLAVFALRGRRPAPGTARAALLLAAALAAGFVPWLATTANGRYFIAGLLIAGPVCVALVWLLPMTRWFRLALAVLLVALQGFAVQQSNPWQAWSLGQWKQAPYFGLELTEDMRLQPATYVTLSNISYSLMAPLFPSASRWMSLANAPAAAAASADSRRAQAFLAEAVPGRLVLLMPIVPGQVAADGLPTEAVAKVIDDQIAAHRLAFTQPRSCRFLRSRGLASMALGWDAAADPDKSEHLGFWACQATYLGPDRAPAVPLAPMRYDHVFRMVETTCPRLFPPGVGSLAIPGGEVRNYSQAEMKAYVLDTGDVFYKYYRAFNPVRIGKVEDVLSGKAKVDCSRIRGRSGLPWEREI